MAASENSRSAVAFLVTLPEAVDLTVRVNITLPEEPLRRIHERARNRSAFLARAAEKALAESSSNRAQTVRDLCSYRRVEGRDRLTFGERQGDNAAISDDHRQFSELAPASITVRSAPKDVPDEVRNERDAQQHSADCETARSRSAACQLAGIQSGARRRAGR